MTRRSAGSKEAKMDNKKISGVDRRQALECML
jgi:hypothetical protein